MLRADLTADTGVVPCKLPAESESRALKFAARISSVKNKTISCAEVSESSTVENLCGDVKKKMPDWFLTVDEVCEILNISRATLYNKISDNPKNKYYDVDFPQPFALGNSGSAIRFSANEIFAYMNSCLEARKSKKQIEGVLK